MKCFRNKLISLGMAAYSDCTPNKQDKKVVNRTQHISTIKVANFSRVFRAISQIQEPYCTTDNLL